MKQIQTEDELAGKTVAKIYKCFEELWISFTDGTFVFYRAENNYGDTSLELVTKAPNFIEHAESMVSLGLVTREEVSTLQKERAAVLRREQEENEKRQLAALLSKYPRQ